MKCRLLIAVLVWVASTISVHAVEVKVAEAFINLHTGPASEYPIFHVVARGETIDVLKKRTDWYKVKTTDGKQGWVSAPALSQTLNFDDQPVALGNTTFADYQARDWELAVMAGSLDDVTALSVSAGWVLTENIVAEVVYTQALGKFSENQFFSARIKHFTFPEWRVSPYLLIGAGQIRTTPRATLVQSGDDVRTSDMLEAGIGARYYLSRNFVLRAEYTSLLALTDRDEQEELEQWKLGFSVFF